MKYFVTNFALTAKSMDIIAPATDILQSFLADIGYEAFQNDSDEAMIEALELLSRQSTSSPFNCFSAYVQQPLFDEDSLKSVIANMPFDGLHIYYSTREAEDKNWNEQWEATQGQTDICRQLGITIDVKQAFGTGGHFTTRMILEELMGSAVGADLVSARKESETLAGKTVLDCGCGSGILSIAALKLGATHATAYDIDEWSVRNTRHNADLNGISPTLLTVLEGDATVLDTLTPATFDIILANINRNILLNDLPRFVSHLAPHGTLILSGFYTTDADILTQHATALGLTLQSKRNNEDWCMLVFFKKNTSSLHVI